MPESILRSPLTGLLLLAGATGGPYLWYETELGKQGQKALQSATGDSSSDWNAWDAMGQTPADSRSNPGLPGMTPSGLRADPFNPNPHRLDQMPIVSLAEVLRFDVSPDWVMGRFPRVSTLLAEMNLDGLRAPLVTGTSPSDLAGTVTYYFDQFKRLKRICVQGNVGDPTRYVAELQQAYQMSQEPSLGGNLYVIKWNGTPTSLLHIAPASVVHSDSLYGRFQLFLELNQAGLEFGLSPEARHLVEAGRHTQRW